MRVLTAAALTLALLWASVVLALALLRPEGATVADAVRLLPTSCGCSAG